MASERTCEVAVQEYDDLRDITEGPRYRPCGRWAICTVHFDEGDDLQICSDHVNELLADVDRIVLELGVENAE